MKLGGMIRGATCALSTMAMLALACSDRGGQSVVEGVAADAADESTPTAVPVVIVRSQPLDQRLSLPGELLAFQDVAIQARVQGFVEWIAVDRGSAVKAGQVLARLVAPELIAERNETEAKAQAAEAQLLEGQARLAASEATYKRLRDASATPGVVAGNDLDVAQQTTEADRARVELLRRNHTAMVAAAAAVRELESYLQITAPFDGVITERYVHTGALVGPATVPMFRIQQTRRLRLVVPVPETAAGGISSGGVIAFTVPAFPGERFDGRVARIGHALDQRTRTMAVELDVVNQSDTLKPGMFPEVIWPVRRARPSLFVPSAAIGSTTERASFVVRVRDGVVEWIDVQRGAAVAGAVEVFGDLGEGDYVAARGTDELRPGTRVTPTLPESAGR